MLGEMGERYVAGDVVTSDCAAVWGRDTHVSDGAIVCQYPNESWEMYVRLTLDCRV